MRPVSDTYFADPAVVRTAAGYAAFGTTAGHGDGRAFATMTSPDLREWTAGPSVVDTDSRLGPDYWAPEVIHEDGVWWMFFSIGGGGAGHQLRVARADNPLGPYLDQGICLSEGEDFAIDPHPFVDEDGTRYLFFARDVPEHPMRGTHLAVQRMASWTRPEGAVIPVLEPNAQWQRYERDRDIYGKRADWYTLEGPSVVKRGEDYVLFYSGGCWEGPHYGVATAIAPSPLGPWRHDSDGEATVLSEKLIGRPGPGHNSLVEGPDQSVWIMFHAWNDDMTKRQAYTSSLQWSGTRPSVPRHLGD